MVRCDNCDQMLVVEVEPSTPSPGRLALGVKRVYRLPKKMETSPV